MFEFALRLAMTVCIASTLYFAVDMTAKANELCSSGPLPQGYTARDRAERCKGRVAVHARVAHTAGIRINRGLSAHAEVGGGAGYASGEASPLTQEEIDLLARRAREVLGPRPADASGLIYRYGIQSAPADDCTSVVVDDPKVSGLHHVRWRCPPGTIQQLGQ